MARGWESKAVAEQMDERDAAWRLEDQETKTSNRTRQTQLHSLKLSRARIADQLAKATNPTYRTMLERALASLDAQLAETEVMVE